MTLPDEAIEAAAKAVHLDGELSDTDWEDLDRCRRLVFVAQAEVAIAAALPHLVDQHALLLGHQIAATTTLTGMDAQTVANTVERIFRTTPTREQIAQAIPGSALGCCTDCPVPSTEEIANEQACEIADAVLALIGASPCCAHPKCPGGSICCCQTGGATNE